MILSIESTGKGQKAHDRLEAIDSQVEKIVSKLKATRTALGGIIGKVKGTGEKRTQGKGTGKNRSAVKGTPERIEFWKGQLSFYIDFTLSASESEGLVNVEGCIVYGISRPLCFADCLYREQTSNCEACDRISRCDRLEDKPLVRFCINRDGIIKSGDELDAQWRMLDTVKGEENKKTALDIHYRALDHIWKDALDWTNENILP